MDRVNMQLDVLQDVLLYFCSDDIVVDILQEIVDAGFDNTNQVDDIVQYLEEVGYERN